MPTFSGIKYFYHFFPILAISIITWEFLYADGIIRCAKRLHANLLANVIRLPMSFFEMTPVGRMLSRFSSDIHMIDLTLPHNIKACTMNIFKVCLKILLVYIRTFCLFSVLICVFDSFSYAKKIDTFELKP